LAITLVVATVGFNFHVLVPVLADKTLNAGPSIFGLLSAAFGLGAVVGALAAAGLGRASWKALLAGLTLFSSALILLAPQSTAVAAGVLLFLIGIGFTVWMANAQSILQLAVPDYLRGRIVSLFLFCFGGFAPLGSLLAGWLSDIGGTELAFLVAGGAAAGMTLVAAGSLRRVLRPVQEPLPG
jgi:MFS family permease